MPDLGTRLGLAFFRSPPEEQDLFGEIGDEHVAPTATAGAGLDRARSRGRAPS